MSYQYKLDMTMMFAIHDALRRELERIARVAARGDEDPRRVLSTAVGWELFKKFLQVHHSSEDTTVWPVMHRELAGRPDDLALLDEMEAEHAVIDPLLDDIDAALADRESGLERLGGLVDTLHTGLSGHLKHEEAEALQLMDRTMTQEEWTTFSATQRDGIGDYAHRYLPWILDEMEATRASSILMHIPAPLRAAYEAEWREAYASLDLWGARNGTAAA
jgi:iron-sulfur cluster repair protein YtfE (RIC family)